MKKLLLIILYSLLLLGCGWRAEMSQTVIRRDEGYGKFSVRTRVYAQRFSFIDNNSYKVKDLYDAVDDCDLEKTKARHYESLKPYFDELKREIKEGKFFIYKRYDWR